jgi:hypothetical protein
MFGWFKRKELPPSNGPDFSVIDSRAKAEKLVRSGELERLFLMPLEFGGQEVPLNTLYVPVGIASVKAGIDNNIIGPLAADGKITNYSATPEYQGKSFIPIAIKIVASDPGQFSSTINIWGEALTREDNPDAGS